jgi:hypothetical protein
VGGANRFSEEWFCRVGQGAMGDVFMEIRWQWPEKFWKILPYKNVLKYLSIIYVSELQFNSN